MNELPQFDPKLKEAAAEIEAICKKYGVGGFYCLASSTHGEFNVLFPEWSLIWKDGEHGYRIRMKSSEHSPEQADASLHLLYSLRDMAGLQFQNFEAVCQHLSSHLDIEHKPFHKLWDLDGWQKPNLGAAPAQAIDFNKQRKRKKRGKGFGGDRP